MGHQNKKSLIKQVEDALTAQLSDGQSKHDAKRSGDISDKIYSFGTLKAYLKQCCFFVNYCKKHFKSKTLEDCRPHVNDFIRDNIDRGLSPATIKLRVSAIAKLYNVTSEEFITTPPRTRSTITRSRGTKIRDGHFSEARNADLVSFCRSTGLRRRELSALTGDKLIYKSGKPYIKVINGKGGRYREAPVIGDIATVERLMKRAGSGKVFRKISGNADIHGYRADYACSIYKSYARPLDTLTRYQRYYCRRDMRGVVLDRAAMLKTSNALGHNRINVIAGHYLYNL